MKKNKKNIGQGELLIRKRINNSLNESYIKQNVMWKHTNGPLYKFCILAFWLLNIFSLMIVSLNAIVVSFSILSSTTNPSEELFYKNNYFIIAALFLLYAISLVLMRAKKVILSSYTIFVVTALLIFQIVQISGGYGSDKLVWFYIPSLVLFVVSLIMFVIEQNDRSKLEKMVQKEISKIYQHFSNDDENVMMTQHNWDDLLLKYEQQELYNEKNIKKAKKIIENTETEDPEETE